MTLVYRIETEDGRGPYRGPNVDWGDHPPVGIHSHPTPNEDSGIKADWEDMGPYMQERYSFGFTSEAQFRSWFYDDDWLVAMKDAGLMLSVYDVKDWRGCSFHGHRQAVFRKDVATLVLRRELI